jgi:PAS domain S-box-containing protein
MNGIIHALASFFESLPIPLLEVWGRFAYVVGLGLAVSAFGGFTFRPGGHWGIGRERQAWDSKAVLSIPLTFVLIILTGYVGSFIVLVPGAQTFESLKDLVVFLSIVLFGYPALITVPFAYGLSDLIEGVPPNFLLDWLPGYFINPACFWIAYQFFGKNPDFRRRRTWLMYLAFVVLFMSIEPVLWGYICGGKFTPPVAYRNITPALFFTTAITWILAPLAMLFAYPLARKAGMFWAEIPRHVKERRLGHTEWIWEASGDTASHEVFAMTEGWPIRVFILAPFIALVLLMVGVTAFVTLRSAEKDANKLATRLHQEIADNINLQLDEYLSSTPADTAITGSINDLLKRLPISEHGLALIIDGSGLTIASSAANDDGVAARAVAGFTQTPWSPAQLKEGVEFRFDYVVEKPLSRQTWLTRATAYQDRRGGHADWVVLTVMPESYYLEGAQAGGSRSAMIFALALLLSLAVAAVLAGLVTGSLRRLSLATETMAQGDLSQRVPGSRMEELGTLAYSFNRMAEQLQESFDDLRDEVEMRKRRELELEASETQVRSSENRLQLALRAGRLAIWDWDVEKDQLIWDDSMYQLYDVRKEEFSGAYDAWASCLAAEDFARATADVEAALRGERAFASDFLVRLKDGSTRFIRGVAQTIRDNSGKPVRMVGINWDVTDQVISERTLRDRETFLRLAQEAAKVGSWEWDIPTNRFTWSDELARMHGIGAAEFDGKLETMMSFCHPSDVSRLREAMEQISGGTDLNGFEYRIMRRDGDERDVWFLGRMQRDDRGLPSKVLGIAIDITERKRRDLILADEARILGMIATGATLREILTAIVLSIEAIAKDTIGSILLLDADGIHVHNGAAVNLPEAYVRAIEGAAIGPKAGSCGTAMHRREPVIVSDIETDPLWDDYRELARTNGLRACWSTPILDSRGATLGSFALYYRSPRSPLADDLALIHRATHLAGVAIERKQSEEQLWRSEERFQIVARATNDAIWDWDLVGGIIWWNQAITTVFKYSVEEIGANAVFEYRHIHPEDRERVIAGVHDVMNSKSQVWSAEYRFRRADGSYADVFDRAFVIYDDAGKPVRMIGAVADISERKRAMEILEQRVVTRTAELQEKNTELQHEVGQRKHVEDLLRRRNDELRGFAYTVSHDLKAPLRGIAGYAQELDRRHRSTLSERAVFCLTQITTATHNLDRLIDDLLHYSRLDAAVVTGVEVDLNRMVESTLRDRAQLILNQNAQIDIALSFTVVRIWERGLYQVLTNLIDNALKYSRNAKPPRISIASRQLAETFQIIVSDNGIGFDMKYHDRIFGLFNRLVRQEEFEGTGAGLAIVKKVVEKMGGRIWAESTPGRGAKFFVELPKQEAAAAGDVR